MPKRLPPSATRASTRSRTSDPVSIAALLCREDRERQHGRGDGEPSLEPERVADGGRRRGDGHRQREPEHAAELPSAVDEAPGQAALTRRGGTEGGEAHADEGEPEA